MKRKVARKLNAHQVSAIKRDAIVTKRELPTPAPRMVFEATPKQAEFFEAVMSGRYRFCLYGGAIRGGKSYTAVAMAILFARMWAGSRWAIVRKDLPTLKRNVLPVWEKLAPEGFAGPIHRTDWKVDFLNGSEILFFTESIKDDPDLDRWKGLEVNGFFLEEANELQEKTFNKAIERAGSWIIPGLEDQPPPIIIATCNPAQNWVKAKWYDPWVRGELKAPWYYLPSKITDNPHLPAEYIESLKSLPPREYKRFVEGDWSVADDPDQLIQADWADEAFSREPQRSGHKRMGVDVARFGDDATVIAIADGHHVEHITEMQGADTQRVADAVAALMTTYSVQARDVRVDTVGVGSGVADALVRRGFKPAEFIAGAKAVERRDYLQAKNLRTQGWWDLRELARTGKLSFGEFDDQTKLKILGDLTAPRYSVGGDKVIALEAKDQIKKRLGRSPDHGDAIVMALAEISRGGFFVA